MIESHELRIGNKVRCSISNDAGIYTVLGLPGWENDARVFMVTIDRCPKQTVPISKIRPIKLNHEILTLYGFKYGETGTKEDRVEFWDRKPKEHKHSFGVFYFSVVKWYKGKFTFSHHDIRSDCEYLHQLQNIWFSLIGEELNEPDKL